MPKVLVTYASRHETTKEIAEAVASALIEGGLDVDLAPAADVSDLAPYGAVVIGTPIYAGRILREAVQFVERHEVALRDRKVAAFVVGMSFRECSAEVEEKGRAAMDPIRSRVDLMDLAMFAGRMNPAFVPLIGRLMKYDGAKTEDCRNWETIEAWAKALPAKLGIDPGPAA